MFLDGHSAAVNLDAVEAGFASQLVGRRLAPALGSAALDALHFHVLP